MEYSYVFCRRAALFSSIQLGLYDRDDEMPFKHSAITALFNSAEFANKKPSSGDGDSLVEALNKKRLEQQPATPAAAAPKIQSKKPAQSTAAASSATAATTTTTVTAAASSATAATTTTTVTAAPEPAPTAQSQTRPAESEGTGAPEAPQASARPTRGSRQQTSVTADSAAAAAGDSEAAGEKSDQPKKRQARGKTGAATPAESATTEPPGVKRGTHTYRSNPIFITYMIL